MNIAMLSGGKDSTAMVLRAAETGEFSFDEYIFCDTGKEFPAMYDHLTKVESYLGISITRLKSEKSFEYYFGEVVKTKGKNKGKVGYSWPDHLSRWCTANLKTAVSNRYLKQFNDVVISEGIAVDEWNFNKKRHRASNGGTGKRYPLLYWAMTEAQCLQYCYERGFDWDGLYEDFGRVSCFCCPLSNLEELRTLRRKYPEQWAATRKLEERGTFRKFRKDYSLQELEEKFAEEDLQGQGATKKHQRAFNWGVTA